jgi:hypothetical protein
MAGKKRRLTAAEIAQRRAAAKRPRGGTRPWITMTVSADVAQKIDLNRGDLSRNSYLDSVIPMPTLIV